jgi:hypothetical protein
MTILIKFQKLGISVVILLEILLIAGCTSDPVRIYNTVDIPDSILTKVSYDYKPISKPNKNNINTLLYDYINSYYALMVCNARIDYIKKYINKYNDMLIN